VDLLERFHASQTEEAMETRFHARLSKAQALAGRQSRSPSSALSTMRDQKGEYASRREQQRQRARAGEEERPG
jgi:hypothetical protein